MPIGVVEAACMVPQVEVALAILVADLCVAISLEIEEVSTILIGKAEVS